MKIYYRPYPESEILEGHKDCRFCHHAGRMCGDNHPPYYHCVDPRRQGFTIMESELKKTFETFECPYWMLWPWVEKIDGIQIQMELL